MNDQYLDRLAMRCTVLDSLSRPEYWPVWQGQPPLVFEEKVEGLRAKVAGLAGLVIDHETNWGGITEEKQSEEKELEDAAYEIGSALSAFFGDRNAADKAREVELSRSGWRKLRDEQLLARARTVLLRLAEEPSAQSGDLAHYGLTPEDRSAEAKEIGDYEAVMHAPTTAISGRKAITQALRPHFREVSDLLNSRDKLVLRFNATADGQAFIRAYQSARIIRDSGGSPGASATAKRSGTPKPAVSQREREH
jgi:hypothetical protein